MQSLGALITRVRESRADTLAADATTLFARASDLYETAAPDDPQANRRRHAAHRLAARAEHLTARSYRWRPTPVSKG